MVGRAAGIELLRRIASTGTGQWVVDRCGSYSQMSQLLDEEPYPIPDIPSGFSRKEYGILKESGYVAQPIGASSWPEVLEAFVASPLPWDMIVVEPYGGNINKVSSDHCAFVHRDVCANIYSNVFFRKSDQLQIARQASARIHAALQPHTNGHRYPNYPKRDLDAFGWVYWGNAYSRLVAIKRKYDPDHFFRFQQSIGNV